MANPTLLDKPPYGHDSWLSYAVSELWLVEARPTARKELETLQERSKQLEKALTSIFHALDHGPCQTTAQCDGCDYEWQEALKLAAQAIGREAHYSRSNPGHKAIDDRIKTLTEECEEARAEVEVWKELREKGCDCGDDESCRFVRERDDLQRKLSKLLAERKENS